MLNKVRLDTGRTHAAPKAAGAGTTARMAAAPADRLANEAIQVTKEDEKREEEETTLIGTLGEDILGKSSAAADDEEEEEEEEEKKEEEEEEEEKEDESSEEIQRTMKFGEGQVVTESANKVEPFQVYHEKERHTGCSNGNCMTSHLNLS